ncbi:hypothetical protein LTR65_004867 [Meristemomyces frigidus]
MPPPKVPENRFVLIGPQRLPSIRAANNAAAPAATAVPSNTLVRNTVRNPIIINVDDDEVEEIINPNHGRGQGNKPLRANASPVPNLRTITLMADIFNTLSEMHSEGGLLTAMNAKSGLFDQLKPMLLPELEEEEERRPTKRSSEIPARKGIYGGASSSGGKKYSAKSDTGTARIRMIRC